MSYTISLSNGQSLFGADGLPDGTIDTTSTSLALVGKNYPGYGVFLNSNLVHLVENFANSSAPIAALPGQIWFDSANKSLKVNVASAVGTESWKVLAGITNAATKAAITIAPNVGEFWWDTTNNQLKVYSGLLSQGDTGWVTVGPASNTTTGQTGAQPDTVVDVGSVSHVVVKFYIAGGDPVAILSKDVEFTPSATIPGFQTIKPGFNLSTATTNRLQYFGNANVAMSLMVNGSVVSASNFTRSDVVTTSTVPIITSNIAGLAIGPTSDFVVNVTPATTSVGLYNTDNNYDTVFYVKTGGVTTPVLKANGALGALQLYNDPTTGLGVATKQYVDLANASIASTMLKRDGTTTITGSLTPAANVTYNLGSSTAWFNVMYGKSYQAQYADLAERFAADAAYEKGTVVELGGDKEVTLVKDDLSDAVFGVVSTGAAYLLNSTVGSDKSHPAIALAGRVPVNVVGIITKGDRLVSAGNGFARAGTKEEITPWNVIGRALENKTTTGNGVIEAIVKVNS